MGRDKLDPVDLMMRGRMDDAAKMYLDTYVEAVEEGDRYIGPHLLSQLHYCVAGKEVAAKEIGRAPEDFTAEVERMVLSELRERGVDVDERMVQDDIAIAKNSIVAARKDSEKVLRQWI